MIWRRCSSGHLLTLAVLSLALYIPQVVVCQTAALLVVPATINRNEDQQVVLLCKNSDDTLPVSIKWRLPNGVELGPDPEGTRIRNTHHLLEISSTERGDTGPYTCIDATTDDRVATAQLTVTVPPQIVNHMPVQEIRLGETMLVRCEADRGFPLADITWYKDNSRIGTDQEDRVTIREDGLEIRDVQESDEGEYECYLDNSVGFDSLVIQVAFTAPPQFINPGLRTDVVIRSGEAVDLDCSAAGAPSPSYTWVAPPTSSAAGGPVNRGPILRISFTSTSDSGLYSCTVSNGIGEISRILNLTVVVPPKPVRASHNRTVRLGQSLVLDCRAEGHPPPSYTWFLFSSEGVRPLTDSKYVQLSNGTLRVSQFDASDFDSDCNVILLCSAENAYGESNQYYTLSLDTNDCNTVLSMRISTPTTDRNILSDTPESTEDDMKDQSETKKKRESILIGVFSGVLLCLTAAVVVVFLYLLTLCRRSKQKHDLESGRRDNSTGNSGLTNMPQVSRPYPTPRSVPLPAVAHLGVHNCSAHDHQLQSAVTNQSPVHSSGYRGSAMDSGMYSKLNHYPDHRHPRQSLTRSSTSSTNSNSPLLQSQSSQSSSGSVDDNVFVAGPQPTASPHGPIGTLPEEAEASCHGPNGMYRGRQSSTGGHVPVQVMQPPQYLELRGDSMNPPSHYETIP